MSFDPDRSAMTASSDDAMILSGIARRTADEMAAVAAAVVLSCSARTSRGSRLGMQRVLARVRGFGALARMLSRPLPARVELAEELSALCVASAHGRAADTGGRMDLDLAMTWVSGAMARRLIVVAAGLVDEAIDLAFRRRSGRLRVVLRQIGNDAELVVEDDAPGPRVAFQRSDACGVLAAELVRRSDGTLTMVTGTRGSRVTVVMPTGLLEDDEVPF